MPRTSSAYALNGKKFLDVRTFKRFLKEPNAHSMEVCIDECHRLNNSLEFSGVHEPYPLSN